MSVDQGLFDWVAEALEPLGQVTKRPMMGVATLYLDGVIFGVIDGDELWMKADEESGPIWDAEGCERFTFTAKDGRVESMNYRRAPLDVYDDPDAMRRWSRIAQEAGLRSAARKKPRKQG